MRSPRLGRMRILLAGFLVTVWTAVPGLLSARKVYWHFTVRASWGEKAHEWAWVTMVEMPKSQAYPEEAALARKMGGELQGYVLAQVRAAALRSSFEYEVKGLRCHDRPAVKKVSWSFSESDLVFAHGQILDMRYDPSADPSVVRFRFGLCNNRVLFEDGRWRELRDLVNVFPGPVGVGGRAPDELRGEFHVQGINYGDPLEHFEFCEKGWWEPLETPLTYLEHDNLTAAFDEGPNELTLMEFKKMHGFEVDIMYTIQRSFERTHPFWKQLRMN